MTARSWRRASSVGDSLAGIGMGQLLVLKFGSHSLAVAVGCLIVGLAVAIVGAVMEKE